MIDERVSATRDEGDLDVVFRALASRTRREILDSLREGPKTTGELVWRFPGSSRFAVMQHLKVLSRARLVVSKKSGRERHNYLNVVPIHQVYERWVRLYETPWAQALSTLKSMAEGLARGAEPEPPRDDIVRRGVRGGHDAPDRGGTPTPPPRPASEPIAPPAAPPGAQP